MRKFQVFVPCSLEQASFFPHIIKGPSSILLVPRVRLIYLAFPALPNAPLLARQFEASRSIIIMIIVIMRSVDIHRKTLVHDHLASILHIIKPHI